MAEISATDKVTEARGLEITPGVECVPGFNVATRKWEALAAIRHAFRLPEAASTTAVSGCRSSVREITGKRRATKQTMAAPCILVL
jgi:hypothetical protein